MIRAAVFDLDGTLVDSLADIAAALDGALADLGLATPTADEVRGWVGDGALALVARAVAAAVGDVPAGDPIVERVHGRFRERYRAAPVVATRPYDGIPAVLDRLDAAGVTLAVLSNKPHDLTVTIVERLFPGRFTEVAGHRPGAPLKPSHEAGLSVAAALGVAPADCAMVGDSAIDVATAHAAGMRAIAVSWGLRPRAELEAAAPDAIADNPSELLALLL